MIRKLRKKFILTNMVFVVTILAAALIVLYGSYFQRTTRSMSFYMENELSRAMGRSDQRGNHITEKELPGFAPAENTPGGPAPGTPGKGQAAGVSGERKQQDAGRKNGGMFSFLALLSGGMPQTRNSGSFLPSIVYEVDADGTVLKTFDHDLTIDDTAADALISQVIAEAGNDLSSGERVHGTIPGSALKYLAAENGEGSLFILFCDVSFERSSARSFLFICGSIFLVALLLFFILSLNLSKWALAPVEKAWEQQNRFVADASHELKTPVTVILANLDIIAAHKDETVRTQMKWVRNTKEEAERMRQLIQDLLFLAKSDANTLPVMMTSVDLTECAEDRVLNFESLAFEKNVTMESDIAPGLTVKGNEGQLKQLITILLDNAVKYAGPDGRVRVTAFRKGDRAVISVNNTGEPIPPEDAAHIFERFYRASRSRARTEGGYGLGLSIAENIVKAHGGQITCASDRASGTTFTADLPLDHGDSPHGQTHRR